jgi:hypothetical protein
VPRDLKVHVVLDNLTAHSTPESGNGWRTRILADGGPRQHASRPRCAARRAHRQKPSSPPRSTGRPLPVVLGDKKTRFVKNARCRHNSAFSRRRRCSSARSSASSIAPVSPAAAASPARRDYLPAGPAVPTSQMSPSGHNPMTECAVREAHFPIQLPLGTEDFELQARQRNVSGTSQLCTYHSSPISRSVRPWQIGDQSVRSV